MDFKDAVLILPWGELEARGYVRDCIQELLVGGGGGTHQALFWNDSALIRIIIDGHNGGFVWPDDVHGWHHTQVVR